MDQILNGTMLGHSGSTPAWLRRVYVLSPFERPVNVFSQQCRALNLTWALEHVYEPEHRPRTDVAVVGGGAAGVTAAVALGRAGFRVTLIEREAELLPSFSRSIRFLHPRLYDWPAPTFSLTTSALPLMNWQSGLACDVAESLRRQFSGWQRALDIKVQCATRATEGRSARPRPALCLCSSTDTTEAEFDVVILAPGFGAERFPSDGDREPHEISQPWWEFDERYLAELRKPGLRILGSGDGALSDVFESIGLLQSELAADEWIAALSDPDLLFAAEELESWIATQRHRHGIVELGELDKGYVKLVAQHGDRVVRLLTRRAAGLHLGVLNRFVSSRKGLYDEGAYALNRFLLACLRASGAVAIRDTPFDNATPADLPVTRRFGPTWRFSADDPDFGHWAETAVSNLQDRGRIGFLRAPAWPSPVSSVTGRSSRLPEHAGRMRVFSTFYNPEPQHMARERLSDTDFRRLFLGRLRRDTLLFGELVLTDAQVLDGAFFRRYVEDVVPLAPSLALRAKVPHGQLAEIRRQFIRTPDTGGGRKMRFWSLPTSTSLEVERRLPELPPELTGSVEQALRAVAAGGDVDALLADWQRMDPILDRWQRVEASGPYERRNHFADLGELCRQLRTPAARALASDIWNAEPKQTRNSFDARLAALDVMDQEAVRSWAYHGYDAALAERHCASVFSTIWTSPGHDQRFARGDRDLAIDCVTLGGLDAAEYARVVDRLGGVCQRWRLGQVPWQDVWRAWRSLAISPAEVEGVSSHDEWSRRCASWLARGIEWECWVAPSSANLHGSSPRVVLQERSGNATVSLTTMAASLWLSA